MGKIAACSGGLGDILYGVKVMHLLGVARLYVKEAAFPKGYGTTVTALQDLLALQNIECLPTDAKFSWFEYEPSLIYDYDLDKARLQPRRGRVHIIRNFLRAFGFSYNNWNQPWLKIDDLYRTRGDPYTLIALTPRWRDNSRIDWTHIRKRLYGRVCFTGFEEDYNEFVRKHGLVEYIYTANLLEMARLIRDCSVLYTNQNPALVIAQGIGKTYWLEQKPARTNTLIYTYAENILR